MGLQPPDITEEFNKDLVISLVDDLSYTTSRCRKWCHMIGQFIPKYHVNGNKLRSISEICLPILPNRIVSPLVEALLCCTTASDVVKNDCVASSCGAILAEQALSPHFINELKDDPKDFYFGLKQCHALSYKARLNLWLKDDEYFEEEIITLLEICCFERQDMSLTEMKKFISKRELPKALNENPSLLCIAYEIVRRVVFETRGSTHVTKFLEVLTGLISDEDHGEKFMHPNTNLILFESCVYRPALQT